MIFQQYTKFSQIIGSPYYLQALFKGSAAGTEHLKVLHNLNCKFVIDIGANRGQFALVARKCFPRAFIHSVEPLDEPAKIFLSIFENDPEVTLHQCAIGSKHEVKTIHVSKQDDSSSLLPIGSAQVKFFPNTGEKEIREVNVLTLDELIDVNMIPVPSLLKIDVQGYELETLKGCVKSFQKINYIYVEVSFIELYEKQALAHQVITFLTEYGFNLEGVYNVYYDNRGKAIQADFLFVNVIYKLTNFDDAQI